MLLSFFATPFAMLTLGFARSLPVIAVSTFVLGCVTDLYRPAVNAAVADMVPPEDRTRAYGYIYWAINVGAAIAPLLAGLLARSSYLFLFIADAATTFSFGLIVLFTIHETRPSEAHQAVHASLGERIRQLKRAPILLVFSFLMLFFGMIYMQELVTLPLDMTSHGLGPEQYGLAISMNGFLIVLFSIPIATAAAKWPRFPSIAAAAFLIALGFGFTAFADSTRLFAVSVAIWTFGEIIGSAVAPAIVADLSPVELRGLFQGVFGSAWGLSAFLGPVVGGWVFEHMGASVLWGGCFGLGCLVAVGCLAMGRWSRLRAEAGSGSVGGGV
jgi:MFS family permease